MTCRIDILFECVICYEENIKPPTLYKCSKCNQQICDTCYPNYIANNQSCAFCRSPLIISNRSRKKTEKKENPLCSLFPILCLFSIIVWVSIITSFPIHKYHGPPHNHTYYPY